MEALLTKTIDLPCNHHAIPKDTIVQVDLTKMIAFFNGVHFDIFPDEFTLLN